MTNFYDNEEKKLIASVERGEWTSIKNKKKKLKELSEAASMTLKKTERMNIRISKVDLDAIKIKAAEEGLPYQTLVSSIIHKYAHGTLRTVDCFCSTRRGK